MKFYLNTAYYNCSRLMLHNKFNTYLKAIFKTNNILGEFLFLYLYLLVQCLLKYKIMYVSSMLYCIHMSYTILYYEV